MSQVTSYVTSGSPLTMAALAAELNAEFAAVGSLNRGATAPSNPFEGMLWLDTSGGATSEVLKRYTVAGGWVSIMTFNITAGTVTLTDYVAKATYDANTILAANTDNTPVAVTVAEDRIVGRVTGGNIAALTAAQVQTIIGSSMPTGTLIAWPTGTVPTGYLECDGASISTTTYAALYAVLGTAYGSGSGTFNLPDYRGQFMRGWAHGQTTDPDKASRTNRGDATTGDFVGTKQAHDYKAHTHPASSGVTGGTGGSGYFVGSSAGLDTGTSPSSGGNETRPVNINVMYVIKY